MMKYVKNNSENGAVLVFAIGLLALLLLVGLAFVGNSINYRKVAENNSSRSQARMFALSAVSRAASSLQIYSHQYIKYDSSHEPPKSFDHIFSFAKYDEDGAVSSGGAYEYNDGLVGDFSLMLLPENSSVLSTQRAQAFNSRFLNNWPGKWVFFTNGLSDDDRRIIGRAAWQVVGSPAEILAPVFMRGQVTVDPYYESGSFYPNEHRWGREIDEVVLPTGVFTVGNAVTNADSIIDNMGTVYSAVDGANGSGENAMRIQRWVESWFIPDFGGGTVGDPTATSFTETYGVGRYNRLRFNISELNDGGPDWKEDRGGNDVYEGLDQWYARLGITSESESDANSEIAITRLTADAPFLMDHTDKLFDWQIFGERVDSGDREFGGLPFLRRIGNTSGTFADLSDLRKQIAANFNDYCDTDGIPTSDVPAATWLTLLGTDDPNPTYTGNELTPYLYEIGVSFGVASSDADSAVISASREDDETGKYKYSIGAQILAAPVVKLCNIYPFNPGGGMYSNFGTNDFLRAYVDLGKLDIKFQLRQVKLKDVEFSYVVTIETVTETTVTGTDDEGNPTSNTTTNTDTVTETRTFKVDAITLANLNPDDVGLGWYDKLGTEFTLTGSDWERTAATAVNPDTPIDPVVFSASDVDNSSGSKPYPWKRGASGDAMWQKALPATALTFYYTLEPADFFDVISSSSAKLKKDVTLGTVTGTGSYPGDLDGYKYALYGKEEDPSPTTETPDANTTITTTVTTTYSDPKIKTQPSSISVDKIEIQKFNFAGIRRAILTANIGGEEVGIDFVGKLMSPDFTVDSPQEIACPTVATVLPGFVLGSSRNYDPRQNLNNGDWLGLGQWAFFEDIFTYDVESDDIVSLLCLGGINTTVDLEAANNFVPFPTTKPNDRDEETADEPAYKSDNDRISTAVIRNAPMMSPWEIGFIHRGIRWQTINIKNAGFTNFTDNEENWGNTGSTYQQGDGAILEQIKMSDRIRSYGKININRLRSGDTHFKDNETQNLAVAQSLFTGLVYNENPLKFIIDSTRNAGGLFPDSASAGGTDIDLEVSLGGGDDYGIACASNFALDADRGEYSRRIAFLDYDVGDLCLENAFSSTVSNSQTTDAAQEEIIGKTINLLSAHRSSPNIVYVVIVAQSIRDRAGEQVQLTTETDATVFTDPYGGAVAIDDGVVTMACKYGRFDYFAHDTMDPGKNIYFDEITGEVKMFVQLHHDTTTGQLTILKIDYL